MGQIGEHLGDQVGDIRDKIAEWLTGDPKQLHVQEEFRAATTADPIKRQQKRTLCLITMVAVSLGTGVFAGHGGDDFIGIGCFSFLMIYGASVGMLFARWRWCPRMESHSDAISTEPIWKTSNVKPPTANKTNSKNAS